ncbi:hypothetical protein Taro_004022 [Colocasia esculenta]|uniref:Pentatricopeptide repeat-containing protein n=1 Tax=Colocasia esculenta TaxID=4460 RepID=A0A843TNC4_COLES|nr:hypothetical protein [Colocasia esculenta]
MPSFLSHPAPLFALSSAQFPGQLPLSPYPHPGLEEEIRTHDTLKPGGTRSPLPIPSARCCSDNPTRSTRPQQIPFFTRKRGGVSGGSPVTEERRVLACGRSASYGEKSSSNRAAGSVLSAPRAFVVEGDERVSPSRKTTVLPPKALSTFHSVEEVGTLQSVQVAESSGFVNGIAGVLVGSKDHDGVVGTPNRGTHGIVRLVSEMAQLSGNLLPKTDCDGRRAAPTVGQLADGVGNLCCRILFQEVLRKRGDQLLTIWDFNELLLTLIRHGELESAVSLFCELPSYGLSPNCWSFSIMIQCLCKKNDPDKGKEVLYDMVQNGFSPSTVLVTILIHSFCKKGKLQSAYELFERMDRMGCHPTIRTYNCLISGLCYVGRIEEAFQLLKKIKKTSADPDIYTFTTVIDGFCKVGRIDEAIELLNDALELGIKPNVVTFNSLINGFCREGRIWEGCGLLREMKGGDCQPDHISYNTLLQGSLKCGEISEALNIYNEMRETGLKVEERAMNTLLRKICRKCVSNPELLTEAEGLFQTINDIGYKLSPYTYCLMVQAFADGGHIDKALAHLSEMERIGFSPRIMTYNMLIRVLCGEQRVDDALFVFILMLRGNRIPSTFSCNRLFNEFNQQERFLDACSVYAAALKHGVHLCQQPRKQSK